MREAQRTALGKQAKHRVQAVSFFWGGIPRASQCFAAVNDPKPTAGPRGFLESGIPPHPLHLCASARNQKKSAQIPPRPVSSACHQPGVFRRRRPPIQDASKPSPPHRLWHTPLPLHLCVSARNQKKPRKSAPIRVIRVPSHIGIGRRFGGFRTSTKHCDVHGISPKK